MFGKKTAEAVMRLYAQLSDDEKAKVMEGLKKPDTEDEKQIAEAEEYMDKKGEEDGTKDQTAQDIEDESVGEQEKLDGDKDSQTAKDRIDESKGTEEYDEDKSAKDNSAEMLEKLTERVGSLEEAMKELSALKDKMNEYAAKNAERFGYKGGIPGAKKSWDDMTADEMKNEILNK